ncbi:tetratricopeptide repeat protein [Alicyclobacillaceae bacterium I2511]|jgi:tetratricopeptide (TPR) repeat protein|nr:tetratricopeptide repeat protein [Alicyclobacillaceae bacterium I2511]
MNVGTKFSDKAEPHYLRAVQYEQHGRIEDAIREYRMANRIKKDLIPARKRMGDLLVHLGRLAEAIQQYEKAVEITSQKRKWNRIYVPEDDKFSLVQVLAALVAAYDKMGETAKANEMRQKLLGIAPTNETDVEIQARMHTQTNPAYDCAPTQAPVQD